MAFKRMKPARPAASAPIESHIVSELRRADALMEKGKLDDSYEIVARLHLRYPQRQEPLLFLMDLAVQIEDLPAFEDAAEALVKLFPGNAEYALAYARSAAATRELRPTAATHSLSIGSGHLAAPALRMDTSAGV